MSRLIDRFRPTTPAAGDDGEEVRYSLDQLIQQINYLGNSYPIGLQTSMRSNDAGEEADVHFSNLVNNAYRTGGPVFACVQARAALFSEARFQWQNFVDGRPGDLFGTPALALLEEPWPGGTTGDLLIRAEQDVSLGGNWFVRHHRGRLWRLRPDWITIVLGSQMDVDNIDEAIDAEVVGYLWGKPGSKNKVRLLPEEVIHWAPIPDPEVLYRGMSWVAPVIREVQADQEAVVHKHQFFRNSATPNLVVLPDASVSYDEFKEFVRDFRDQHEGAWNAYRTLFLGGGSKVETVGLSMKDMEYSKVQGIGETRIAAAANVPAIIAGFSQGLEAATYANYGQARRKFGDHFARPQWRSVAGAIAPILDPRPRQPSRLWYDDRDIAFLREDRDMEAKIHQTDAITVRQLIEAGYQPNAAVAYVRTGNPAVLVDQHSGLMSVQLNPPGVSVGDNGELPGEDDVPADPELVGDVGNSD